MFRPKKTNTAFTPRLDPGGMQKLVEEMKMHLQCWPAVRVSKVTPLAMKLDYMKLTQEIADGAMPGVKIKMSLDDDRVDVVHNGYAVELEVQ